MASHFSFFSEDITTSSKVLDNEIHEDKGCKCKRRRLYHNDNLYYIFYRKCVCGNYNNMLAPTDLSELPAGHISTEGIDIHGNASCTYEYVNIWGGRVRKNFVLHCYCGKFSGRNTIRWLYEQLNYSHLMVNSKCIKWSVDQQNKLCKYKPKEILYNMRELTCFDGKIRLQDAQTFYASIFFYKIRNLWKTLTTHIIRAVQFSDSIPISYNFTCIVKVYVRSDDTFLDHLFNMSS